MSQPYKKAGRSIEEIRQNKANAMRASKQEEIIADVIREVSNKRHHPKHSIGYMCGMLDAHSNASIFHEDMSRGDVIKEFETLLHTKDGALEKMLNLIVFNHIKKKHFREPEPQVIGIPDLS